MDGLTEEILALIREPVSDDPSEAVSAVMSRLGDIPDTAALLAGLREIKADMRSRNIPGDTSEPVIEGVYLDAIPRIIMDDRMYRLVVELERRYDPSVPVDVDLHSISLLYTELIDIVATDLRIACRACREYPSEKNVSDAVRCLELIRMLDLAGAEHLSIHSRESPASYRAKMGRNLGKCREYVETVTVGTGIRAPEIVNALADLTDAFESIVNAEWYSELQEERNADYREYHRNIHDWLVRNIQKLNIEMESLDPTDFTQRRYLSQLITLSQDALNRYNGDH